jgi:hypothetical protein
MANAARIAFVHGLVCALLYLSLPFSIILHFAPITIPYQWTFLPLGF